MTVIVWDDADVSWAAETCVSGAFAAAGQNCIGVQRLYVHERVYDEFRETFVERTKQLKLGSKLSDATDYRLDAMPFGGVKESGIGREGVRYSVREMTEPKVACWLLSERYRG